MFIPTWLFMPRGYIIPIYQSNRCALNQTPTHSQKPPTPEDYWCNSNFLYAWKEDGVVQAVRRKRVTIK